MPMSLLSATVLRVRPAGVTGDFCPVCRRERRFRLAIAERRRVALLMEQGPVGHPMHELTCTECGCKMERPPQERPIKAVPTGVAAERFEPECLAIVKHRIDDCTRLEAARVAGRLKPDGREEMIRQCVHAFARIYDEEVTERVTPRMSGALLASTVVLGGSAVWLWLRMEQGAVAIACGAAAAAMWGGLWYWVVSHSPRKRVRTWLARSLAPLDATEAEIRQARRELQAVRIGAGFKIQPAKVRAKIERMRASGV
jgi:hypothetical protein